MAHTVIIGNGISGITTARHLRKRSSDEITIISGETEHFYSRTALMYIFMGHMRFKDTKPYEDHFWKKNKLNLRKSWVQSVDFENKTLSFTDGGTLGYDRLVLACGSKPNTFGWPGQDAKGVQGLYHIQDLETLEEACERGIKRAVIVGGGLIGVELAEMLRTRNIPVTFLVREENFWGNVLPKQESKMIAHHMMNDHHIDLRFMRNLEAIKTGEDGWVKSIVIKETGEELPCDFVGLTPGVSPNIDFVKNTKLDVDRGIMVNAYLETNLPHVYAIGDCAQFNRPPGDNRRTIEQVWYTGRMQGECLGQTLAGKKTPYKPGVWFNSAKFFDIEYQTYGWVFPNLKEGQQRFYWQHPTSPIALHVVFSAKHEDIIGVNVFGIRLRHQLMEEIIQQGGTVEDFLVRFRDYNFDPEFYTQYGHSILKAFNKKFDRNLRLRKRNWKNILSVLNRHIPA